MNMSGICEDVMDSITFLVKLKDVYNCKGGSDSELRIKEKFDMDEWCWGTLEYRWTQFIIELSHSIRSIGITNISIVS